MRLNPKYSPDFKKFLKYRLRELVKSKTKLQMEA